MAEWWNGLETLNKFFYGGAGFFTLIFVWQFMSMLIGMSGSGDMDADGDVDVDMDTDMDMDADGIDGGAESTVAFHIFSVRAILAFFTMFTWAGALYMNVGKPASGSIVLAFAWGFAGWTVVAVLLHWLRKLAESGTRRLRTCLGQTGTVYMDIPAGGQGEVRVAVSGVVSMVKARVAGGAALKAGSPVTVTKMLDINSVQVRPVGDNNDSTDEAKE